MSVSRSVAAVVVLVGVAAMGQVVGCWEGCPEQIPVESGDYIIVGLANDYQLPADKWLLDRVVGAELRVDRDAEEATIRYTKDGTTYEVRYTLE